MPHQSLWQRLSEMDSMQQREELPPEVLQVIKEVKSAVDRQNGNGLELSSLNNPQLEAFYAALKQNGNEPCLEVIVGNDGLVYLRISYTAGKRKTVIHDYQINRSGNGPRGGNQYTAMFPEAHREEISA